MKGLALILFILCAALGQIACAQSVTFAWTVNAATGDPNTNTAGYNLHIGTATGVYTQTINVGNVAAFTVSTLTIGTNYFAVVKAYNAAGIESPPSNQIAFSPTPPPTPTPTPVQTPLPTPLAPTNLHVVPTP